MKHLIKNNQIVQSGIPESFTRENGESFWGGYQNMTELHYQDGWRDEVIPQYDPVLDQLGEPFYSEQFDVVIYSISPRTDLLTLETIRADKIQEIKSRTRDLLFVTDGYIIRRAETGKSVPQGILNSRQAIRVWSDAQEKLVTSLIILEDVLKFEVSY